MVYIDDILVFTDTLEEHRRVVKEVLAIARQNKLAFKLPKCKWEREEIDFLGSIIGHSTIRMDPKKVTAVAEWPTPKTKKEVQAFLGFANYYRRFIRDYSEIAIPMTRLTGKTDFVWERDQQEAFDLLKQTITSAPVLSIPSHEEEFRVKCDASDYAIGGVLSQLKSEDNLWHPCAFMSKTLSQPKRNYEIYDKEMLAVMSSFDEWRQYLMGAKYQVDVWSDHQNLSYFRQPQKFNRRQARWLMELANFDFKITHKPGKVMAKADALSRRADYDKGENNNEDITLLPDHHFRSVSIDLVTSDSIYQRIRNSSVERESYVQKCILAKDNGWLVNTDGLVLFNDKLYVPADKRIRDNVISIHHDSVMAGHLGRAKTLELVTRTYWWPRVRADVYAYMTGCEDCQRTKANN